jgi:hypothetical protein
MAAFNITQVINLLLGLQKARRQSRYVKPVTIDGIYKKERNKLALIFGTTKL